MIEACIEEALGNTHEFFQFFQKLLILEKEQPDINDPPVWRRVKIHINIYEWWQHSLFQ